MVYSPRGQSDATKQTHTINNTNMYVVDMHAYWVEQKKNVKTFDWCVYI